MTREIVISLPFAGLWLARTRPPDGFRVTGPACWASGMPLTSLVWTILGGLRTAVTGGPSLPANRQSGSSPMVDRS